MTTTFPRRFARSSSLACFYTARTTTINIFLWGYWLCLVLSCYIYVLGVISVFSVFILCYSAISIYLWSYLVISGFKCLVWCCPVMSGLSVLVNVIFVFLVYLYGIETISRTDEGQPRPKCIFNKMLN